MCRPRIAPKTRMCSTFSLMTEQPHLLVEQDGHVLTLTMNRPNARNALSAEMVVRLTDAWAQINEDPSIYDAYLFDTEILKDKKKAFEQARRAVTFNPDYVAGWAVVGRLAASNNDKKTLADAIGKLGRLSPTGSELKELQKLRH